MEEQRVAFPNRDGQRIVGTLLRGADHPAPGVLVLHGFRGDRDERHISAVSEEIAEAGLVTLRIDLTNNAGESGGEFRKLTISQEVRDAQDALDFMRRHGWVEPTRIGIAGHSVGGLGAALTAARDPTIGAVVTLSAVFDLADRFARLLGEEAMARWAKQGEIELDPPGSGLNLDYGFFQDATALDLPGEMANLRAPLRIVQGEADNEVPPSDARLYYQYAASLQKELALIPHAGHLYRGEGHLELVCGYASDWFVQHLQQVKR